MISGVGGDGAHFLASSEGDRWKRPRPSTSLLTREPGAEMSLDGTVSSKGHSTPS